MLLLPIHNEPALLADEISTLIIADLHIGIEYEMLNAGIKIPHRTDNMKKRLLKILKDTKVKRLAILGDLKHKVPGASFQESREIPEFVESVLELVKTIDLVPGNHDGGVAGFLPDEVKIHKSDGFVIGNLGMWHGHTWPSKKVMAADTLIVAHTHPAVLFIDGVGSRSSERCWLKGALLNEKLSAKYKKIASQLIMMPAFNPLCGHGYVNEKAPRPVGVLMRHGLISREDSHIYLLDGTYLGTVSQNLVEVSRP
jgi:putative SbcD/Mre11-related phosphoesterase